MITTYISVGSNIEREKHIVAALEELTQLGSRLRASRVFEAEPVGFEGSNFFNLVIELETSLSLPLLAKRLREIELKWGRKPDAKKNEDRTLDLDILLYGEQVSIDAPVLPRQDIYKFAFALWPMAELCPEKKIPGDGRTFSQLWHSFNHTQSLWPVELLAVKEY